MTDPALSYEQRVAHVVDIKLVNNQYPVLVTLKVFTDTPEKTVNIANKYIIIFAEIKMLN